jgi:hypothetical protein
MAWALPVQWLAPSRTVCDGPHRPTFDGSEERLGNDALAKSVQEETLDADPASDDGTSPLQCAFVQREQRADA